MSGGDLEAGAERTKALDMALGQIEKQFGAGAHRRPGAGPGARQRWQPAGEGR